MQQKRTIRRLLISSPAWLFGLALLALACGPTTSAPPQAAPTPAVAGATQATQAIAADWQADWTGLVAGARQEGKLVIAASPSDVWRDGITTLFKRDFPDIGVEYTGIDGRNFWPKLQVERQSGQYLWDVRVGGPDEFTFTYKHEWLDPLRPLLFRPDVVDDSNWVGGLDHAFADNEKQYSLAFTSYMNAIAKVNRDILPLPDMQSEQDLLNPKYRGKIVLQDPRGGSGLSLMSVMLAYNGEDFVRQLLTTQQPVVTDDSRQMAEWVIRGRYPIGIGLSEIQLASFAEQGVMARIENIPDGPRSLAVGAGGLIVMKNAPHPNAVKLFANWLLTREVQTALLDRAKVNSRRTDVPVMDPGLVVDRDRLGQSFESQFEDFLKMRQRMQQIATEVLPG
jgi:ABC-type Fe3+ transport system substrate-binding protein